MKKVHAKKRSLHARATKSSKKSHASRGPSSPRWKIYGILWALLLAIGISVNPMFDGSIFKTQATGTCSYSAGISGMSSVAASSTAVQDLTISPAGCTTDNDVTASVAYTSGPEGATTLGSPPVCTAEVSPLKVLATGVTKTKINCTTTSSTLNGLYKYTANMTSPGGAVPATSFTFSVTGGYEPCTGLNVSTEKATYTFDEAVMVKYSCASPMSSAQAKSVTFQMIPPGADASAAQTLYTVQNVSGGSYYFPASMLTTKTAGSWMVRTCINSTACTSGTNSTTVQINASTTAPAACSTYGTSAACSSGSGCYWATKKSGTNYCQSTSVTENCTDGVDNDGDEYIDKEDPGCGGTTSTTGGTGTTTTTGGTSTWVKAVWTFKDGQTSDSNILNRTDSEYTNYIAQVKAACLLINKTTNWKPNAGTDSADNWKNFGIPECGTTTTTTTTTPTPTNPSQCATGARCPSGSWCQNGQQFYYSNGDITCVAWSNDGTQPEPPAGTTECSPTDTNCVGTGQTVPYTSTKWCRGGQAYYSTDGKNMACQKWGTSAPAGFSSCKPGDASCIPSGGYGPSGGWCSNGMKFYQIEKDTNVNNDVYCAVMPTGTGGTKPADTVTPPAGYSACSPTDTNCKQKGDKWSVPNSSYYCMNGQKCSTSTGGSCVGWNDSCPVGTKYCTDNYTTTGSAAASYTASCVEPGEKKTITGGTAGYWCGGGGSMAFYSPTEVYCAPKKSSSTTGAMTSMWTTEDVRAVLNQLGSGWGLCQPNQPNCIEPGKTGPSSGWCGWYPPVTPSGTAGSMPMPVYYSPNTGSTRTCPSLDGTTPTPEPKPVPEPINCPKDNGPVMMCKPGYVIVKEALPNGCPISYCKPEKELPPVPKPFPEPWPVPGPYPVPYPGPKMDSCQMLRENVRPYKYEIRRIEQDIRQLPKDTEVPEKLTKLLVSAKANYTEIDKLLTGVKCNDKLYAQAKEKFVSLDQMMNDLRTLEEGVRIYGRCAMFQRDIESRIKQLEQDARRMSHANNISFTQEIADLKGLIERSKEACKAGDKFAFEDLEFERSDIEIRINNKFNKLTTVGRDNYIKETVSMIQFAINRANEEIVSKGLQKKEQCTRLQTFFEQISGAAKDAETAYDKGDTEEAGEILEKLERFEKPTKEAAKQCGIKLEFDNEGDIHDVYVGMSDEVAERIVNLATTKIQTILDERMKVLTEKIAELTSVTSALEAKLKVSLDALNAIPKTAQREKIEETKTAIIGAVDTIATATGVATNLRNELSVLIEKASNFNWCGELADTMKAETEAIIVKAKNSDITASDIATFRAALTAAEPRNNEVCYQTGASRFRDMDTASWYFSHIQASAFFKGNPDGTVEPGRAALRAEALIAIERAVGIQGVDGKCALTTPEAGVPEWANCAVNEARARKIDLFGRMDVPAMREEVASWIVAFNGDKFPATGAASYIAGYSDRTACRSVTTDEVSTVVANGIMTGGTGINAGKWGCAQPLDRAGLATILNRLADLVSLTGTTNTPSTR